MEAGDRSPLAGTRRRARRWPGAHRTGDPPTRPARLRDRRGGTRPSPPYPPHDRPAVVVHGHAHPGRGARDPGELEPGRVGRRGTPGTAAIGWIARGERVTAAAHRDAPGFGATRDRVELEMTGSL